MSHWAHENPDAFSGGFGYSDLHGPDAPSMRECPDCYRRFCEDDPGARRCANCDEWLCGCASQHERRCMGEL